MTTLWAEGWTAGKAADSLAAALETAIPGIRLSIHTSSDLTQIEIPTAGDSDYDFCAFLSGNLADLDVSARLTSDPDAYFWLLQLECEDWTSFDAMFDAFRSILLDISVNPTRIRESSGWVFRGYNLEYSSGGRWVAVPGSSALRFSNFHFAEIRASSKDKGPSSRPWSRSGAV